MKRYLTVGIVSGVLLIVVVAISWFLVPGWHNPISGGFWVLVGIAIIAVVTFIQGVVSIWKDLKQEQQPTAPIQSVDSQKADSIYNAPGGIINIVQQAKISEASNENVKSDIDLPNILAEENQEGHNTVVDGLNWEFVSPSTIFDGRLRDAFPGLRGTERIQGEEAASRLSILLRNPLFVNLNEIGGGQIIPFWWFRGRADEYIQEFEQLHSNRIRMDIYEMQIEYIVAVREFSAEERNFVYVHTSPDKPTGLYKYPEGWLENYLQDQLEKNWGYYFDEEYGIWNNHLIKREEYDDGAAMVDGKPTDTRGAKLRVRYITPYNFVICGQNHVLNHSADVSMQTTKLLDEILLGTRTVDDLVEFVETLHPLRFDYNV